MGLLEASYSYEYPLYPATKIMLATVPRKCHIATMKAEDKALVEVATLSDSGRPASQPLSSFSISELLAAQDLNKRVVETKDGE